MYIQVMLRRGELTLKATVKSELDATDIYMNKTFTGRVSRGRVSRGRVGR